MNWLSGKNNIRDNTRPQALFHMPEAAAAIAVIVFFAFWPPVHDFDLWLQPWFFNASAGQWFFPPGDRGAAYWFFYRGAKTLIAVAGGGALVWLLGRALMRRRWRPFDTRALLALCVVGFTPLIIGILKKHTGVSCPAQETIFLGPYLHTTITDRLFDLAPLNTHLRCWPAGHASAGFGLLGYRLFAPVDQRMNWRYWWPGLTAGWVMGIYQMARGQHYLSHTIVTMALAVLLTSIGLAILDHWRHGR